jgi:hypothetical protein
LWGGAVKLLNRRQIWKKKQQFVIFCVPNAEAFTQQSLAQTKSSLTLTARAITLQMWLAMIATNLFARVTNSNMKSQSSGADIKAVQE